jgi:hypothetical protein
MMGMRMVARVSRCLGLARSEHQTRSEHQKSGNSAGAAAGTNSRHKSDNLA